MFPSGCVQLGDHRVARTSVGVFLSLQDNVITICDSSGVISGAVYRQMVSSAAVIPVALS